jgi:RHS repeat-associated protein
MRTAAAKGESSWRLIAAGLVLLLAANAAEASRFTPSSATDLLEKQGTSSLAAAQHADDLAATLVSEPSTRFPRLTAADRETFTAPLTDHLSDELAAALEGVAGEKLASGGLTSELRPNLWRLQELTTISHPTRFAYARARWYDPRNASWLSGDPLGDVDSPNLYAYVGWQPHMRIDPLGTDDAEPPVTSLEELNARNRFRVGVWRAIKRMDESARMMMSCPMCVLAAAFEHGRTRGMQAAAHGAPVSEAVTVALADMTGLTELTQAAAGYEVYGGPLTLDQRFEQSGSGTVDFGVFTLSVAGGVEALRGWLAPRPATSAPAWEPQWLPDEQIAPTRPGPRAGNRTRAGITRTNPADWRATRDLWDRAGYGDLLSHANRKAIATGRTPTVDEAWIAYFTEDAGLKGEPIPMHHIQGGPISIPLAATRHLGAHMPRGFRYNPGGPGSAVPAYPRKPGT